MQSSAKYLHKELPVRIAHRIKGFRSLPFIIGCNPTVLQVVSSPTSLWDFSAIIHCCDDGQCYRLPYKLVCWRSSTLDTLREDIMWWGAGAGWNGVQTEDWTDHVRFNASLLEPLVFCSDVLLSVTSLESLKQSPGIDFWRTEKVLCQYKHGYYLFSVEKSTFSILIS